jgi:hypothetical protein
MSGRKLKSLENLSNRQKRRRFEEKSVDVFHEITSVENENLCGWKVYETPSVCTSLQEDNSCDTAEKIKVCTSVESNSIFASDAIDKNDYKTCCSSENSATIIDDFENYSIVSEGGNTVIGSDIVDENIIFPENNDLMFNSNIDNDLSTILEQSDETNLFQNAERQLKEVLKNWVSSEQNVPSMSVNRLLSSIHNIFPSIPTDVRTLLPTKSDNIYVNIDEEAQYIHITNWIDAIKQHIESNWIPGKPMTFTLATNVDGIPIFLKSPNFNLYPNLTRVQEFPSKIFTVGLFCSNLSQNRKMPHSDIMMKHFIEDLKVLKTAGIETDVGTFYLSLDGPFICDAPCRSNLKGIISHAGHSSCERCTIKGGYAGHHVTFCDIRCASSYQSNIFR